MVLAVIVRSGFLDGMLNVSDAGTITGCAMQTDESKQIIEIKSVLLIIFEAYYT
jgi:hypothetical protein